MIRKQKVLLVHPTGAPFASHAAHAFEQAGMLECIVTAFAYQKHGIVHALLQMLPHTIRKRLERELSRRDWIIDSSSKVSMHPLSELKRMLLVKTGLYRQIGINYQSLVDDLYHSIDCAAEHSIAESSAISGVYAYEDGALRSFEQASRKKIPAIYDLPIMFHRSAQRILQAEAELFPAFRSILLANNESAAKQARKDSEIALSTHIIVASSVTKASLTSEGIPLEKISVIPYGIDLDLFKVRSIQSDTFRALFVGRVGPRKGVHYLINAWKNLNLPNAELTFVGIPEFSADYISRASGSGSIKFIPSIPHRDLPLYYQNADVLVFPSLLEGFGMVILEAMSSGIPVIASTHTCAPDLIDDGIQGFIVEPRNIEALMQKIEYLYSNREHCREMGLAARTRAALFPWSRYENSLLDITRNILSKNSE